MPPKVAPTQVVIVPILFKSAEAEAIAAKAKEITETLKAKGFSVILDDRGEYTPGWKFNQWELKGVPIRIELGPRDLKQGQVVMVQTRHRTEDPSERSRHTSHNRKVTCRKFKTTYSQKPEPYCRKKPLLYMITRSSRKLSVTKVAF